MQNQVLVDREISHEVGRLSTIHIANHDDFDSMVPMLLMTAVPVVSM